MKGEKPTTQKLLAFMDLEEGWHFGEGKKIARPSVYMGLQIHHMAIANGFQETDAFPGVDGEVCVTVYCGSDYYEITVETDGTITFIHEVGGKLKLKDYREGLSICEITEVIGRLIA